jgi:transcriptional regulator with XRE-family HTH domain
MNKLREIRFYKRISQFKLAALSRVHQSKISLIENDLIDLNRDEKERIAEALGMTLEEIFGDKKSSVAMGNRG